jgi:hypothetical protein
MKVNNWVSDPYLHKQVNLTSGAKTLPHRRRRVFSFFDFRSSFSRFSDFIEASPGKKTCDQKHNGRITRSAAKKNVDEK